MRPALVRAAHEPHVLLHRHQNRPERRRRGPSGNIRHEHRQEHNLDGVALYSAYRGTDRTPQQDGYNPADTPHNLSVAASTSLPWTLQLSGALRVEIAVEVDARGNRERPAAQRAIRPVVTWPARIVGSRISSVL
jgi:hypothetical protein